MSYINVGAQTLDGRAVMTKGDLKRRMKEAPQSVSFYSTAAMGPEVGKTFSGGNLPAGHKLQVCGPDPYSKRVWYATVTDAGKVT